jgi:hypothetical protein
MGMNVVVAQELENLMAMNTSSPSTDIYYSSHNPEVDGAAETEDFTKGEDIFVSSYFTLAGKQIIPYMKVENAHFSFDPEMISVDEKVFIQFNNDHVEFRMGTKTYRLPIQNIEQLSNKNGNCLVTGKIEINCKATKIQDEKVDQIAVYIDRDNHISFIQIGSAEYYLQTN